METSNPLSVHEIQYQYEDTRDLIVGKINWPQKKRAVKEEGYENNEDRSDSEKSSVCEGAHPTPHNQSPVLDIVLVKVLEQIA